MKNTTYKVRGNKTAADVVAGNDETLETGYTLEEAKLAAISYQRDFKYVAAWIEEEESKDSPRPVRAPVITRSVERDVVTRRRYTVVYCDGWAI